MKELSITQALEQGYEYCGYPGERFQKLIYIENLESHQIEDTLMLAQKDLSNPTNESNEKYLTNIKLILGEDRTHCDRCDETVTFDNVVDYNDDASLFVCEKCSQDLNEDQCYSEG